jgi:hypothetical protein
VRRRSISSSNGCIRACRGRQGAHVASCAICPSASGEVGYDPDEQVQHVVRLILRKFEDLGMLHALVRYLVQHDIQLGVRVREGPAKGTLEWRRPNRMTLQNLLKHPIYAGAYAYGRRQGDPRKQQPGRPSTGRVTRARQAYQVLLKEHVPASITWAQDEQHLARFAANRARADTSGAVRHGPSLAAGLLVCGRCHCRMQVCGMGDHASCIATLVIAWRPTMGNLLPVSPWCTRRCLHQSVGPHRP